MSGLTGWLTQRRAQRATGAILRSPHPRKVYLATPGSRADSRVAARPYGAGKLRWEAQVPYSTKDGVVALTVGVGRTRDEARRKAGTAFAQSMRLVRTVGAVHVRGLVPAGDLEGTYPAPTAVQA